MALPSGLVTFLFTDIEGSTNLFASRPDDYPVLLERHNRAIRDAVTAAGGHVISSEGDAFFVAFADAPAALVGAAEAQRALAATDWPAGVTLRVRMGLHTGAAQPANDNYVAFCVHQAARVVAASNGGQIVVSSATAAAATPLPHGLELVPQGRYQLRDFAEPEPLFTLAGPGLAGAAAALRAQPERNENLPAFRTQLFGRQSELDAVTDLITRSRVVTLTGLGGVGKTRTATAVATAETHRRDGVWFCALDAITDPSLVLHTLAESMGKRLRSGSPDELARMVGNTNTLVVVDNCEHVLDAAAAVVDALVRDCPELRVLATSQAPLDIEGEQVFRLDPLRADGASSPALALFTERAAAAGATWTDDPEELASAAEIVARLDGIPLAIELAAARSAALSPREIERRLDHRFTLLASSRRDVLPRRRALLATIEWSYDLLDPADAALLRRLAYFAGAFDLDAAEAMAEAEGVERLDALDGLSALVNRSLVAWDDTGDARRYRLLDSIRAFGLEQAAAAGEHDRLAAAHAAWVRERLPQPMSMDDLAADPTVRGRPAAHLHADIALAVDRLIAAGDPLAAELAWRASTVWAYLIRLEEGSQRLRAAAAITNDAYDKGRCIQAMAYFAEIRSDEAEQRAAYLEAAALLGTAAESSADAVVVTYATRAMMAAAHSVSDGEPERAERLLADAAALATRVGDIEGQAGIAGLRAGMAMRAGRSDDALALSLEQLRLARQTRGPALGRAWSARARLLRELGRHDEARVCLNQAVAALAGEPFQAAILQLLAGAVMTDPSHAPEALRLLDRAEAVASEFGWLDQVAGSRIQAAGVHALIGDYATARALNQSAHDLVEPLGIRWLMETSALARVRIELMAGDVDAARAALTRAATPEPPAQFAVHEAAIALAAGDPKLARRMLGAVADEPEPNGAFIVVAAGAACALGDKDAARVVAAAHAADRIDTGFALHQMAKLPASDAAPPDDPLAFIVAWVRAE